MNQCGTSSRARKISNSPLQYLDNLFRQSDDGKALKSAVYNTITFLLVTIIVGVCISVYYILLPFLTPLSWAVLIGTCLHPFKRHLTNSVKKWIDTLNSSNTPIIIGTLTLPVRLGDSLMENLSSKFYKHAKFVILFTTGFPIVYALYHFGPIFKFFKFLEVLFTILSNTLQIFSTYWVASAIIAYLLTVIFFWTPFTRKWLKLFSLPVWIGVSIHLASITGALKVPLFIIFLTILILGTITELKDRHSSTQFWSIESLLNSNASTSFEEPFENITEEIETTNEVMDSFKESVLTEELESTDTLMDDDKSSNNTLKESCGEILSKEDVIFASSNSLDRQLGQVKRQTHFPTHASIHEDEILSSDTIREPFRDNIDDISYNKNTINKDDATITSSKYLDRQLSQVKGQTTKTIFIALFWAKAIVYTWTHEWIIKILPFFLTLFLLKKLGLGIGSSALWKHYAQLMWMETEIWIDSRLDALAPAPVRGLYKLILRGDAKLKQIFLNSLDNLVSIMVIFVLIFGTFFLTMFLAFQIQNESVELISISSQIINKSMHSAYAQWLPERDNLQKTMDSMMGNAHVLGRQWISKKIDVWLDTSPYNKAKIEEQVLELWDRLYVRLSADINNGSLKNVANIMGQSTSVDGESSSPSGAGRIVLSNSIAQLPIALRSMWDTVTGTDMLDSNRVLDFVKQNLGTLTSVLESIWKVLLGNVSLCFYLITTIISLVFGGGTAVLNFFLSSLVFLTTLYLLLCLSKEHYLPMAFLMKLLPTTKKKQTLNVDNYCGITSFDADDTLNHVYNAVEAAISGVFAASLKMAVFYGLYTSLTHTIFGVNLVFLPSALAALLGAVPFLGTYWAAAPAVLELLVLHQERLLALLLLVVQILPTYFVDPAIYSEIKGAGHPYLTGLAVAGGIYCLGLEGAVIGPILLTGLLVAVNMYSSMLTPSISSHAESQSREKFVRSKSCSQVHYNVPASHNSNINMT